jgi:hypothetical protein
MQLQLFDGLDDGLDTGRARSLDEGGSPRQLPFRGNKEI